MPPQKGCSFTLNQTTELCCFPIIIFTPTHTTQNGTAGGNMTSCVNNVTISHRKNCGVFDDKFLFLFWSRTKKFGLAQFFPDFLRVSKCRRRLQIHDAEVFHRLKHFHVLHNLDCFKMCLVSVFIDFYFSERMNGLAWLSVHELFIGLSGLFNK